MPILVMISLNGETSEVARNINFASKSVTVRYMIIALYNYSTFEPWDWLAILVHNSSLLAVV